MAIDKRSIFWWPIQYDDIYRYRYSILTIYRRITRAHCRQGSADKPESTEFTGIPVYGKSNMFTLFCWNVLAKVTDLTVA